MTDKPEKPLSVQRILMTEEAIYGLILVSGVIVVTASAEGFSIDVLIAVVVTVVIFFAAHVYAGTLSRLAIRGSGEGIGPSLSAAARRSAGMLTASLVPIAILAVGATGLVEDETANWAALITNTAILGVLGWVAVARWSRSIAGRLLGAVLAASFGLILIVLKAVVTH